ncbi:uncharacterized protein [Primulina huaijiensis]|uniref:uncharacterized protein n=1 Tax=Primulina huaijiensis TaxID=1492673 RepID=UPI003CC75865
MTIVSERLIEVENYDILSRAMLIALRSKNKIVIIDGMCARPAVGSVTLNQWERCNALVLSWNMNSVSKDIFSGIVYSSYASAFLMGLNDSYMHIRSQILMMMPLPTVSQAFSLLSQEGSHRLLSSVDQPASVFYSRQGWGDERRKDVLTCEHRGWNGHLKAHCFKLIGYPPGHKLYKPQHDKGNF